MGAVLHDNHRGPASTSASGHPRSVALACGTPKGASVIGLICTKPNRAYLRFPWIDASRSEGRGFRPCALATMQVKNDFFGPTMCGSLLPR